MSFVPAGTLEGDPGMRPERHMFAASAPAWFPITDALPHLSLAQVHAALSYYFDHRDEVQQELKQDEQFVEQLRNLRGPGLFERRLKSVSNQPGDAIPS